jgi:hypothetical protein
LDITRAAKRFSGIGTENVFWSEFWMLLILLLIEFL